MLLNRVFLISGLMLVGFIVTSMSVWALAFNPNSADVPAWSAHWLLARAPILIGVLLVIAGFKLLSATRVRTTPSTDLNYEDPAP